MQVHDELLQIGDSVGNKTRSLVSSTLNRGIKRTKKLKGFTIENCRCLKHNVHSLDTSITIVVQ